MIDHKDPIFRQWLTDILKAEDCTITFTKIDGTDREMKCTLRQEVISEYVKKGGKISENTDCIRVWDIEKSAWRSIRYDSIKAIHFSLGEAVNG